MSEVLVTGGAGYIGSHVVKMLSERGYNPVVYDNFSTGFRDFVRDFEIVEGDLGDYEKLLTLFEKRDISCVMNFASFIAVGESVQSPMLYYHNNVSETLGLFHAMLKAGINRFIFSSSAAVYGNPESVPISESSRTAPANPYGRTKLFIEEILKDMDQAYDFKAIILRYFNAAGADTSGEIGESHMPETHLIPLAIRACMDPNYNLTVFGRDYNTPDGTCIRDYIHVTDLAAAHVCALEKILKEKESGVYNLGNGNGFSVLEVIESVRRITGMLLKITEGDRRPGDPAVLIASSDSAKAELGWFPKYTGIDEIVESAWNWESRMKRKGW